MMLTCPMAPLCDFRSSNEGEIDEHVVTCDVFIGYGMSERTMSEEIGR